MKNLLLQFSITGIAYLAVTFMLTCFFGEWHFNYGYGIGYPTLFYWFAVDGSWQHGFMGIGNLFINILIIAGIVLTYRFLKTKQF